MARLGIAPAPHYCGLLSSPDVVSNTPWLFTGMFLPSTLEMVRVCVQLRMRCNGYVASGIRQMCLKDGNPKLQRHDLILHAIHLRGQLQLQAYRMASGSFALCRGITGNGGMFWPMPPPASNAALLPAPMFLHVSDMQRRHDTCPILAESVRGALRPLHLRDGMHQHLRP